MSIANDFIYVQNIYNNAQDIIDLIRHARLFQGLRITEVAKMSGVPRRTIERLESRQIDPKLNTLNKIAAALGLNITIHPNSNCWLELNKISTEVVNFCTLRTLNINQVVQVSRRCFYELYFNGKITNKIVYKKKLGDVLLKRSPANAKIHKKLSSMPLYRPATLK